MTDIKIFDILIIGAGPAGITAAVYAARKKLNFCVITKNLGGQVTLSSEIENYTGFQYITGEELTKRFEVHLKKFKFDFRQEEVHKLFRLNGLFKVSTNKNEYCGRTVIFTTGRKPKELNVPGENKFKYNGVTYCATCDGPFFEGVDVAVVGGGYAGLEAVLQLVKIANKIYLIELQSELSADATLIERAKKFNKVEIWTDTRVTEILGEKSVKGIKVDQKDKIRTLDVQGVFIEIGSIPNSSLVDFVRKNRKGEVIVNCKCETNIPGFFAAGDVTNVPAKQIVVACGEGCKATLEAFNFLQKTQN